MNTKNKIKSVLTLALAAVVLLAAAANAAITYDGYLSWEYANTSATFDASGSDKLVVVVTGEHGFGGTAWGQVNGVTYDGEPLLKAVDVDPKKPDDGGHGDTACDIWYLDNPGDYHTAGIITPSTTNGNYVYTAIALSGTVDGVAATAAIAGAASVDLDVTSSGSIVISVIGMGGHDNTAYVGIVDPLSPAEAIEIDALETGNYWAGHVVARTDIGWSGLYTFSFDTDNIDVATIAAEFESDDPNRPSVDAGGDWYTWSGEKVELDATVTNEDTQVPQRPLTISWTAEILDLDPNDVNDVTVVFDANDVEDPNVTITFDDPNIPRPVIVELTLTASVPDTSPASGRVKIYVYDDNCTAALGKGAVIDPGDFDDDCDTDMVDLRQMIDAWLDAYELTEPAVKP